MLQPWEDGQGVPELLVGLEVSQPGRHTRTGIAITYSTEGQTYRTTFPAELVLCTEGTEMVGDHGDCRDTDLSEE